MTALPTAAISAKALKALRDRDARWYLDDYAEPGERAKRVNAVADHHWDLARPRREDYARYWSLYYGYPFLAVAPRRISTRSTAGLKKKLSFNVTRSVCDWYVSQVTDQSPRVTFSTEGGTWTERVRAKRLERFNDGMLYERDMARRGCLLALDSAVTGTGVNTVLLKGDGKGVYIDYERDDAGHYFCDDDEAYDGDPRCFYRRRWLDRLQAMAQWPEKALEIATAQRSTGGTNDDNTGGMTGRVDTVCVTWAWHLPSGMGVWGREGTDTGDGMCCITVGSILVHEGPSTHYPFEFIYTQEPTHGVWGDGYVAQLMPIQFEIDDLLQMIRTAMRTASIRFLIEANSAVNTLSISGIPGSNIKYTGTAPIPITPPAVAPEVYQQLDRLYGKAFEIPGANQQSASGKPPPGINSDKQLQSTLDVEIKRLNVPLRLYRHFYLRLARQTISAAREAAEENPDFMVKCARGKMMKTIRWADAELPDPCFAMKEYATSAFALDPVAKMQQVQDSLNSGSPLVTPKEGRRLLNDPDLDAFDALNDASYNLVMDQIADILEDGEYRPPVDKMDLEEALKLGQFSWLEAYRDDCPQEHLDMLDEWIQQVSDLMPPPPPPANAAPPGMPPGPPHPMGGPPPMPAPQPVQQAA